MKNNRSSSFGILNWIFPALLLAMTLVISLAAAPQAQAAPPPATIKLSSTLMADGSTLLSPTLATLPGTYTLAEIAAPAANTVTLVASTPWYANEALWSTLFAIAAGIFGIVRNTQLSTHQKINEALVLGIEQATKIPEVAALENKIKTTIQTSAESYGVQPILHRIVQDLTEPAATSNGSSV